MTNLRHFRSKPQKKKRFRIVPRLSFSLLLPLMGRSYSPMYEQKQKVMNRIATIANIATQAGSESVKRKER